MLACLRVLFGRCRREGMALVGELSGVTAASCLQYLALLIGEGFPQGTRDVQIVINQPMDAWVTGRIWEEQVGFACRVSGARQPMKEAGRRGFAY